MAPPRATSKRRELVTVALRLFADKGIKATTIRDIATAAGVTEGALYRHFAGKGDLARSLFGECAQMLYEHLAKTAEETVGAQAQLASLVRAFFDFAQDNPEAYEFVMARHHDNVAAPRLGQPLPKDVFVHTLEQGMASGELRTMDAHLGAAMVIGMCLRVIFFTQRGLIVADRETTITEVCEAVQRVFTPV